MTWMNPWAWIGLGSLAIPVLVHLLARNRAQVRMVATLRFLEATPPAATSPSRIRDPLLLLLRLLILAVAVSALARPTISASPAAGPGDPPLTRVILVDAGSAMSRLAPDGGSALEMARRLALEDVSTRARGGGEAGFAEGGGRGPARAGSTYLLEVPRTGALGAAASGAASYLARVPGRREIVVYSVLGAGALPSEGEGDRLNGIPLVFRQIDLAAASPDTATIRHPASETRIPVFSAGGGIVAGWEATDPRPGMADSLLGAGSAFLAAEISRSPAPDPGFPLTLVLGAGDVPEAAVATGWIGTPEEVGDLVLALGRDAALGAAARTASVDAGTGSDLQARGTGSTASTMLIRTVTGEPAVLVAPARVGGEPGVLVASATGPDAFLSSAVVGAVGRGARRETASRELDPRLHSPEEVLAWTERFGGEGGIAAGAAGAAGARGSGGAGGSAREEAPDPAEGTGETRFLWALVLLLLTAEWRLRLRTGGVR
ncbi:MAG: hypothetical protein EA350_11990 [Gemmatimonadales bacterium]|nr:MAG: hypothetical protein EA350_11990 [Gemmatimonadales bacterium]